MLGIGVEENEDIWISLLCLGQYTLDSCALASILRVDYYNGTGK
jgi:hypothetical protein